MGMMIHRNRKRKKEREMTSGGINQEENLPFSDSEINFEERPDNQKYTKTDIQRMSKEDLVSLAMEVGIDGAEEMSGADLKKELIEEFGL